jgi:hypothetical protein
VQGFAVQLIPQCLDSVRTFSVSVLCRGFMLRLCLTNYFTPPKSCPMLSSSTATCRYVLVILTFACTAASRTSASILPPAHE